MLRIEELKAGPLEERTMILTAEPTLLALAFLSNPDYFSSCYPWVHFAILLNPFCITVGHLVLCLFLDVLV